MAIGTAAAIVGGAGIVGGLLSAKSQSKAINKATAAGTESNAASLALQRDIYNTNRGTLDPFIQRGNRAGDQINALLGLGGSQPQQSALNASQYYPSVLSQAYGAPQGVAPGGAGARYAGIDPANVGRESGYGDMFTMGPNGPVPLSGYSGGFGPVNTPYSMNGGAMPPGAAPQNAPQTGQTAQQAAENAFDIFRNSTGYQFRFGQGQDALDTSAAARGMVRSGAQMKALQEYGQNFASNEFGNYMGYLGNQQGVGLSGASALSGVGQSYANAATGINNNNASILGNAALAQGNNQSNMWNNVFGGLGTVFGSSYGK